MGVQGSARAVTLLGSNLVCAQAGDAISRIANTSFFIGLSRNAPVRPIEPDRPKEVHKACLASRKRLSLFACQIFGPKKFLTNKFARRFVIGEVVLIGMTRRHLTRQGADIREAICLATKRPEKRRNKMRKTILTILGSALLAASTVQIAAAAAGLVALRIRCGVSARRTLNRRVERRPVARCDRFLFRTLIPVFFNPSDILDHDRRRTAKPLPLNVISATAAYQKHLG